MTAEQRAPAQQEELFMCSIDPSNRPTGGWLVLSLLALALTLLTVAPSSAQTPEWSLLRPSNTGIGGEEIRGLHFAPDGKLWVASRWIFWDEGGLGVLDPATQTWTNLTNFETPIPSAEVNDFAFAPNGTAWIATRNGLVKKQGDSWTVYTTANSPLLHNEIREVELDSQGNVWINNTNPLNQTAALFKFNGTTWQMFAVPTDIPWQNPWRQLGGLVIDHNDHVWIGNWTLPGVAEYNGSTWTLHGQNLDVMAPSCVDSGNGIWAINGHLGYEVYRWNGSSFVLWGGATPPNTGTTFTKVSAAPNGDVYLGNWTGAVAKTTNLGLQWSPFTTVSSDFITGIQFDPDGTDVWIGDHYNVYRVTAAGAAVRVYNGYNTGVPWFFVDRFNRDPAGNVWLATGEGGLSRYDGLHWRNWGNHNAGSEPYPFAGNEPMGCYYQDASGTGWMGGNGIARWNPATGAFNGFWNWQNNPGMDVGLWMFFAEDASGRLFAAEDSGRIYHFDTTLQRWIFEPLQTYIVSGDLPGMQADGQGNIWVADSFNLHKWNGSAWSTITLSDPNYFFDLGGINCLEVAPDGTFWIGTVGGLVRWDGTTFTLFNHTNSPLPANNVTSISRRTSDGLLAVAAAENASANGVSLIQGDPSTPANWTVYRYGSSPLPHWQLEAVFFDGHGDLWISPLSMGVAILRIGQGSSGIEEPASSAPGALRIDTAAPNPFQGSTVLRYSTASEGPVAFEIFNVHGRRIRTLVQGDQGVGNHVVNWNGTDDAGRAVPSGVYFGRIRSGGSEATVRLVRAQ
jgi:flagellar hook capping protein FlgD